MCVCIVRYIKKSPVTFVSQRFVGQDGQKERNRKLKKKKRLDIFQNLLEFTRVEPWFDFGMKTNVVVKSLMIF
jgi:uncharacterized protein YggL (DUF469 family)